jgi:hypothetical protein
MIYTGRNIAGRKPDELMKRVTMWCARNWAESLEAATYALAAQDHAEHRRQRQDADEWMHALVVVNRIWLGIEPQDGARFLEAS